MGSSDMIETIVLSDVSVGIPEVLGSYFLIELSEELGAAVITLQAVSTNGEGEETRSPLLGVVTTVAGEERVPIRFAVDLGDISAAVAELRAGAERDEHRRQAQRERAVIHAQKVEEAQREITAERANNKIHELSDSVELKDLQIAELRRRLGIDEAGPSEGEDARPAELERASQVEGDDWLRELEANVQPSGQHPQISRVPQATEASSAGSASESEVDTASGSEPNRSSDATDAA